MKKNKFTQEEDEKLRLMVKIYGEENWKDISLNMNSKNPRQCHDRWIYYLSPNVNNNPWSPEEEKKLVKLIQEFGRKWTKISKEFPGRNDIQIKNKWNKIKDQYGILSPSRNLKKIVRSKDEIEQIKMQENKQKKQDLENKPFDIFYYPDSDMLINLF
jgi:hypothetical protein